MGTLLLRMLVGGIAGIAAWALLEPSAPSLFSPAWGQWESKLILALGGLIGMAVGGLNGYLQGGRIHLIRGLALGLFFGLVGATLGHSVGGALATALFGGVVQGMGPLTVLSRVVALTPLGLFLGAAIGLSSLNLRRTVQGALGGAIGAAIGAGVFDIVGTIVSQATLQAQGQPQGEVGTVSRAIYCLAMGAAIGLFIGLVERLARSAWLRLSLGRNEGREWPLDAAQTFIGRSEGAHVPLFGDPAIAPLHAVIRREGPNYVLMDGGSGAGTFLNGHPVVQPAILVPGSQIRVGNTTVEFLTRNAPAPQRGQEAYIGQGYPLGGPGAAYPPAPAPMSPYPPQPPAPGAAYSGPLAPGPAPSYPAPGLPTGFTLVALDGPLVNQRFPVVGPLEVGREMPSIPMSFDGAASRRHASLAPTPGGVMVTDLGSTNGTFVNGARVPSALAGPGDHVKIGSTTFRIEPG